MDDEKIQNEIAETVAKSPVSQQKQVKKQIEFPEQQDGQTTLVTGDIEGNEASQIETSPDRGVAFNPESEEVYTGGIALPNLDYNTRRQTPEDRGNPLYFEPNFQPVAPYVVNTPVGSVEATTLDSQKLAWQLATSNGLANDRNYIGYIPVPDVGRLSWWSHFVGATKGNIVTLPHKIEKGVSNIVGTASKALSYVGSPIIEASVDLMNGNPDSIISDIIKGVNLKKDSSTGMLFDTFNTMMDTVDNAVSPEEKEIIQMFDADPEDQTFRAASARGVSSGVVSFGLGAWAGHPEVAFALLNFANSNEMRKQALSAGVAPLWAEAYSIAAPTINTALDALQFDVYINGLGTVGSSMTEFYKTLGKSGLIKVGKAAARHGAEAVGEAGVEMIQESIEGAFDPEFWENPTDRLAIAGLSALAIKGATIPVSVRHARWQEQIALAKSLGVYDQLLLVRTEAKELVDSWAKAGRINESQKNELMELIIREAPDKVIRDLRAGVKGQLDKIPAKDRVEFAKMLKNIDPSAVTKKEFDTLNRNVDIALSNFNISDDLKTMTKGIMNGVAKLMLVKDGTKPSEIKMPKFVLAKSGDSGYDVETNTITISAAFSNTMFTKTSANANPKDDENFNNYLSPSFIPSTRQSDRMSSLLHELAHWVDYQVGEPGFGDFLEAYYDNIAYAFGNEQALKVYKRTKKGADRFGREGDKYTSTRNASEWNAQAVGRLGKRVAKQFGLGTSKANKFVSYANLMLNQLPQYQGVAAKRNANAIKRVQDAMSQIVASNSEVIDAMIEAYGSDRIRAAVQEYMKSGANRDMSPTEYLMQQNMLRDLYDVLDSFADAATLNKVKDFFDSTDQMNDFVYSGDIYFNSGYDNAVAEVQERRQKAKERKAKQEGATPQTVEASNDMRQIALSDGTVVSVPKNLKPLGGDTITEEDLGGKKKKQNEFVGVHAQLPIIQQLNQAKQMMEQKVDEQQIFKETGWYLDDQDKKWKYDIGFGKVTYQPVSAYYANGEPVTRGMFLDEAYDNDKLYEAYPILKNTYITFTPDKETKDGRGVTTYDPKSKSFMIEIEYNPEDLKKTLNGNLIHEVQHTIQDIENFARGGSAYEFVTQYDADRIRNIFKTQGKEAGEKATAELTDRVYDKYKSLAGEIEAENAKKRYLADNKFAPFADPYNVLPKYTREMPKDSKTIVRFHNYDIPVTEPQVETETETNTIQYERLPNDYVADTDPTEEVRAAFENGKSVDIDETPSYDVEVDGRKVGEDIASMTKGIVKRAKNLPNKLVKWFASSPYGWGLDRIMTTMFGRDVAEQFDVQGKYSARNTLRSKAYTRFMKKLEPIIGNIETNQTAAIYKYKTMLNQLGFVRVANVAINNPVVPDLSTKKDLTGWEVMYVYLMKRMGPKFANRIQQTTGTNIDELISTLTEEEKQFANAMSDTLREIWIERVGKERAMWNYFPIMDAEHAFFDETNIDNFRQRMETDNPISIEDAGRLFSKEISRLASWDSGYYRTLKRLRDVLQYKGANGRNIDPNVDAELKKASGILAGQIKDIFGVDGYHNILRLLDTQIADPQEQMLDSASSKTLQQMGNNVIRSLLSFKFLSFPKNLVNITMMWGGAKDYSTYFNGFAEGISDMAGTWKYMMSHSEEIRSRYDNIGYNEFLDQRNTGGSTAPVFKGVSKLFAKMDWNSDRTGNMARMSAVLDMLGETGLKMFMLNGDAVANIYGGYGLIKDYMAQGLSEAEAFKKLDRYIVEHQSSSNMTMKPLRQLEANKSLAGQLMAFTSEGVVKGASILGTFDEVKMGTATKSQAIANALSIGASMVLFALIGAGAWDLWDDDEKVREEAIKSIEGAMVDQLFGFSVLGNGFITPMVQNLLGLGGQTGISAPIWSVATEGITNLRRGEYDRVLTKVLESTGLLIGANSIYNDILGIMMLNSPEPEVREAGFRMVLGHTQNYAEKRTGAEIRNKEKENVENED